MGLINVISVPTVNGIKTIEIHNDDITNLNWNYDVLVISSFQEKYKPRPNTLIKSLQDNYGIIVQEYSVNPLIDIRTSLNCWISIEIENKPFKHILCVEGIKNAIDEKGSSESILSNLFGTISILQYKNINASSIVMPILGAGHQRNSVEDVLPILIDKAIKSLLNNPFLNTIYFVEIDPAKAKLIDDKINNILKRSNEKLELLFDDPIIIKLLNQILSKLIQIQKNNKRFKNNKTFKNIIETINSRNLRFFELAIFCRKLLELLIPEISKLKDARYISIHEHINELKSKNIANWMITYLHTLRVFGNFVAHENETHEIPENMEKEDMIVFSYALNRFLDFYISYKQN